MSRLKKASLGLLGVIALLVTVFIVINLGDDELSPQVQARFASRTAVPAEVLEGYKFELGLFAPLSENVSKAGSAFYEKVIHRQKREALKPPAGIELTGQLKWCAKANYYCSPADLKLHEKELRELVTENSALLNRYDELLKFPGAAGNDRPSMFVQRNSFQLMKLANLKRIDWSQRLVKHDDDRVLSEWKTSNDFYRAKLRYPDSMLGTLISMAILQHNRAFLQSAMQEAPRLKPSREVLQSAELDVPFETIENAVVLAELEITDEIVHLEIRDGFFGLGANPPPKIDFTKLMALGFRPNQTLNEAESSLTGYVTHACVTTAAACPPRRSLTLSQWIKNPVGNVVVGITSGSIPGRLKDMYRNYKKLSSPFSGSGLSS